MYSPFPARRVFVDSRNVESRPAVCKGIRPIDVCGRLREVLFHVEQASEGLRLSGARTTKLGAGGEVFDKSMSQRFECLVYGYVGVWTIRIEQEAEVAAQSRHQVSRPTLEQLKLEHVRGEALARKRSGT